MKIIFPFLIFIILVQYSYSQDKNYSLKNWAAPVLDRWDSINIRKSNYDLLNDTIGSKLSNIDKNQIIKINNKICKFLRKMNKHEVKMVLTENSNANVILVTKCQVKAQNFLYFKRTYDVKTKRILYVEIYKDRHITFDSGIRKGWTLQLESGQLMKFKHFREHYADIF